MTASGVALQGAPEAAPLGATEADSRPPIRIRTGHSYHVYFTIALGQLNARFVERAMTPLVRYVSSADAVSFLPGPGYDAIHAWNAVPVLTRRPFAVTFEDFMPRTPTDRRIGWLERKLRDRLLDDSCVALIALSEYALRQFRWQHANFARLPDLLRKTELIYPVTPLRRDRPKQANDRLRLLFVGRDFMRKGGPVLMRAHRRLRSAGIPVETTVVSALQWSAKDYIGPPDRAYVAAAHQLVAQEGVVHHPSLPNAQVSDLMEAADYLIFPTFHDTFGFVSIEALAAGTPVIATDTCVLPEVVEPNVSGFLLPFENDRAVGKWIWIYRNAEPGYLEAYEAATVRLADALFDRLALQWEKRGQYQELSAGALARAKTRFNPDAARLRLEAIYERFRAA